MTSLGRMIAKVRWHLRRWIDKPTRAEFAANFRAFQQLLPELLDTHPDKFALFRHGKVVDIFDHARDARLYGQRQFQDGMFSVHRIARIVAPY